MQFGLTWKLINLLILTLQRAAVIEDGTEEWGRNIQTFALIKSLITIQRHNQLPLRLDHDRLDSMGW